MPDDKNISSRHSCDGWFPKCKIPGNTSSRIKSSTSQESPLLRRNDHPIYNIKILNGVESNPYTSDYAPYMQGYDRVLLENANYTLSLLNLLNSVKSPSFSPVVKSGLETPTRALDLGCGTGGWVRQASQQWPECQVIGLDLVDKFSLDVRGQYPLYKPSNVTFILGKIS